MDLLQNGVNLPVKTIKISDIILIQNALRSHQMADANIVEMKGSVLAVGLMTKFSVAPTIDPLTGEEKYRLADGARRYTALNSLLEEGKIPDEVTVSILPDDISDIDLLALQIAGNSSIKTTETADYVRALHQVMSAKNYDYDELSEEMGIPKSRIIDLFSTLSLPKECQELLQSKELKFPQAIQLSKVYNQLNDEYKEMALAYAQNCSASDLAIKLAELKTVNKPTPKGEKVVEFIPLPKFIGKAKAEEIYEALCCEQRTDDEGEISDYQQGKIDLIKELFEMDAGTISEKQEKFNKAKEEASLKKQEKDIKKLQKIKDSESILKQRGIKLVNADGEEVDLADFLNQDNNQDNNQENN